MLKKSRAVRLSVLAGLSLCHMIAFAQDAAFGDFESKFKDLITGAQKHVVIVMAQSGVQVSEKVQNAKGGRQAQSKNWSVVDTNIGSGLIVDAGGIVLTRRSVVHRMDDISVQLYTGETLKAKLLGFDDSYGVAVLRIPEIEISNPSFANEAWLNNGNWIFTMGLAENYALPTISVGMIEAMLSERSFLISARGWRGCSGAPVFNLAGQVVGILAALAETDGPAQLEWSDHDDYVVIPIAPMIPTIAEIIERKVAPVAWVGISVERSGTAADARFRVTDIEKNSPAAKADIQVGDELVSFNGHPVRSLGELTILVKNLVLSDSIRFEVKRGAEIIQTKVGVLVKSPTLSTQND